MWKSGNQEELGCRQLSDRIIGAAIAVHKGIGPGFLEGIYEEAMCVELAHVGLQHERQKTVPILYRGVPVGEHRLDLLVEGRVIVELKAISELLDIHFAIVRSYMNALDLPDALLLNFSSMPLGIRRVGRGKQEAFLIS